ncbi:MAG: methyltransferase domain-containing protein [Deltaproteobacteria bacterium]|nr:methyltransferase domain-containing protein [Deltaproteobacteria bacterium]MBW2360038.1 methyltransferase domain-containing protein [Deltaproteobacteria bacterium]
MRKTAVSLALLTCLTFACSFKRWAYEGGNRDAWQQPERVIATLALAPGQRVADLGSGTGYFTGRLARAVAPGGTVYAVDVDAGVQEELRERMLEESVDNVESVLADFDDTRLPDASVDLVFTVNTFHHLEDRPNYFRNLRRVLRSGGRVAVIDFDGRKGLFVTWTGHYTERETLLGDMSSAGYRVAQDLDFLDRQSFIIFAPK